MLLDFDSSLCAVNGAVEGPTELNSDRCTDVLLPVKCPSEISSVDTKVCSEALEWVPTEPV